jgi:hypothetical protein
MDCGLWAVLTVANLSPTADASSQHPVCLFVAVSMANFESADCVVCVSRRESNLGGSMR